MAESLTSNEGVCPHGLPLPLSCSACNGIADEPPAAPAVEAAAARVETELALAGDDPDSDPAFVTDLRTLIAHARASSPPTAATVHPDTHLIDSVPGIRDWLVACLEQKTKRAAETKSERCPHGYELANLRDGTDICAGCRFGVEAHETEAPQEWPGNRGLCPDNQPHVRRDNGECIRCGN